MQITRELNPCALWELFKRTRRADFQKQKAPKLLIDTLEKVIINKRLRHLVRLDSVDVLPGPGRYSAGALSAY